MENNEFTFCASSASLFDVDDQYYKKKCKKVVEYSLKTTNVNSLNKSINSQKSQKQLESINDLNPGLHRDASQDNMPNVVEIDDIMFTQPDDRIIMFKASNIESTKMNYSLIDNTKIPTNSSFKKQF